MPSSTVEKFEMADKENRIIVADLARFDLVYAGTQEDDEGRVCVSMVHRSGACYDYAIAPEIASRIVDEFADMLRRRRRESDNDYGGNFRAESSAS